MKYLVVSFALTLCLTLAACGPVTTSDFLIVNQSFVSVEVEFNPAANVPGNPDELKIESNNQNCPPASASPGCVRFLMDTFGTLSFRLQGQGGNSPKSCGEPGVNWVITKIDGSVTPQAGNPKKGAAWGAALPNWVTTAFYPIDNAATGVLYSQTTAQAKTAVTMLNLNNHKNNLGVKTLYYRVTATKCGTSDTKVSDPGVENEGLH